MTDRRFVYAVDIGGGIRELQIQQSTDEVLDMLAESLLVGSNQVLTTNSSGTITSITLAQNEMIAKVGTASIDGVPPSTIRTLIEVEDSADQNRAASVGGGASVYRDVDFPDPAIINLRSLIVGDARRTKLTQNADTITVDAVITPAHYNIVGNSQLVVGNFYAIFKTDQALTIDEISAVITIPIGSAATGNEDLGFQIVSNPTKTPSGATVNVDMSGANALIDFDDTGTGAGRSTHNQSDSDTRILDPSIAANSWAMIDIISKTDILDGFTINFYLNNS